RDVQDRRYRTNASHRLEADEHRPKKGVDHLEGLFRGRPLADHCQLQPHARRLRRVDPRAERGDDHGRRSVSGDSGLRHRHPRARSGMSSYAAEIEAEEARRERARALMREQRTNSPFHQAVAPAPALEGRALEEAQAWAALTASERYARSRP